MKVTSKFWVVSSWAGAGLLAAPAAFAHTFGAHGAGFADGFAHPFLGLDHMLAMLAVGVWAAQLGGYALWRVPAAFLLAMAGGALLAGPAMELAVLEKAIAASVLALGLSVLFALRLRAWLAVLAVGTFALFHGFAHGLEMPQTASPLGYGLGFLSATACLHLLGVAVGLSLLRVKMAQRVGGLAIAVGGLLLLAA